MIDIRNISKQIVNGDGFTVSELTAAVNNIEHVPGRIGSLGIFDESGITTTDLKIEYKDGVIKLVHSGQRGADGQPLSERGKRKLLTFSTLHLKQFDTILADSLQNVRPFGGETEDDCVMREVNARLAEMSKNNEATIELQKAGALVGKIIEPDGSVAVDLYKEFGIKPEVDTLDLTKTGTLRRQVRKAKASARAELKVPHVAKWRALCGPDFYDDILESQDVKESYLRFKEGQMLRDDVDSISFAGVVWEEYDAVVDGTRFVGADEAILIPEYDGLCITRFAPADYNETVNTVGLPHYAKMEPLEMDRGFKVEEQSNPISVVTVPKAIRHLKLKAA